MSAEELPLCEIGHLALDVKDLLSPGVKYIVSCSREGVKYVLCADSSEGTHIGVILKAGVDRESVVGGGSMALGKGEEPAQWVVRLQGFSTTFKQESAEVRSALEKLVNTHLEGLIAQFVAERTAAAQFKKAGAS